MATVVRNTRVANPARGSGRTRRRLSPKQIKFFGTPAQKAAQKRNRSTKRAATRAKAHRAGARRAVRKNIGQIVTLGLGNPARAKGKKMAKTRKSKARTRSYSKARRATKTNPLFGGKKHHRRTHHSRAKTTQRRRRTQTNPTARGVANTFIKAAYVVAGLVGARGLTQAAYSAANHSELNTSWMGYLSNIAMSFLLGAGVRKFVGKEQGNLVLIGGVAGVVARYVSENTPVGKIVQAQLSGLGDLGIYMPTTFYTPLVPSNPQTLDGGAKMLLPQSVQDIINARIAAAAPPAPAKGIGDVASGVGGRYATAGRYN